MNPEFFSVTTLLRKGNLTKTNTLTAAISSLVFFMGAVSAHSTIVTSVSDPAFSGSFVEDFSSTTLGNYTSLQLNTLTITAPGDSVVVDNTYSGSYNTQGNYLENDAGA